MIKIARVPSLIGAIVLGIAIAILAQATAGVAADRPPHPDVWQVKLGKPITDLVALDMFADFACGTNGGPASRPIEDLAAFTQCRPEADGLREVYFRYDDELEYWARANNLDLVVEQEGGTKAYGYPVILSALVDATGIVRGLRVISDPRDKSAARADAYLLGTFLLTRFGRDTWTCVNIPPAGGETSVIGVFVKQECQRTAEGIAYRLSIRHLRRPGQSQFDPQTGQPTVGQFDSTVRFEMRLSG